MSYEDVVGSHIGFLLEQGHKHYEGFEKGRILRHGKIWGKVDLEEGDRSSEGAKKGS